MNLTLDYGKNGLAVELPDENIAHVLGLSPAPPLTDPAGVVRAALASPIGAPPLVELARGRRDACIVVCDITRPVPNAVVLPPALEALAAGGVPPERVTVLLATGTHRPNEGDELVAILGREVLSSGVRVVNHVCTDGATVRHIGTTERGVPVALNTHYLDADLKITCGLIEPHFMAGYSGGRKMVMPGIAALPTVQAWHSPRFLEHPNATNGVLDDNPVHEENTRIACMAPPDLICDVTLDEKRRMTGVFAGHLIDAWHAGVAFVDSQVKAPVPNPVDIAVTSGGGWPLDATYYQAVKGMVGALPIVRPGGHIVIASECSEGIGGPHFRDMLLDNADLQELVRRMQAPDWRYTPDQWQVEELAKATRSHTVWCVASPARSRRG
jgi:nickel-dependent lactate racemase